MLGRCNCVNWEVRTIEGRTGMSTVDWPLDSNQIRGGKVSNTFGMVRTNADGSARPHQGWDFSAPVGTPCYAVSSGKIVYTSDMGALGLMIILQMKDSPYYAAYCHLQEAFVLVGEEVYVGQEIGKTGNTGNARDLHVSQEHLHFEVREKVLLGKGLAGRVSPVNIFGECPLHSPILRKQS